MGSIGFPEIILIFAVCLLVFGPSKLPEIGKSLGKGIREFKNAINLDGDRKSKPADKAADAVSPDNDEVNKG